MDAVVATIEQLFLVQDHDVRIMKFEREQRDLPKRKAEIEARLEGHRQALAQAKSAVQHKQADIKKVEVEIETRRDKIRKLREQQMQLKTNREFRAMEEEIRAVERDIAADEERVLMAMEEVDSLQQKVREREQQLRAEEESVQAEVDGIDQRGVALQAELDRVKAERARLAAEVDPAWLRNYERIMANRRDRALVPIENGTCTGCHMKLPPYICHEARRHQAIVTCEFCGRMLA